MSFQSNNQDLALPLGSLILVTGATGFIATHIVTETLHAGYRVRGTARSPAKAKDDEAYHANTNYTCVVVDDLTVPSAFDTAIQDCDAVIHVASPTGQSLTSASAIPVLVAAVEGILESCTRTPSIKRFVYTSSSTAACLPIPGRPLHIDRSTWNQDAVEMVRSQENPTSYVLYSASKTETERAVWGFVERRKPGFVVNSVLPNTNFGRILNGKMGNTGKMIPGLYKDGFVPSFCPSQYMVNVRDTARIHLAALLDTSVRSERIFAFDSVFTWSKVIDVISELRPRDASRLQKLKPETELSDVTTVDNALAGSLLKKWFGQEGEEGRGWTGLVETVRENLEGVPEMGDV